MFTPTAKRRRVDVANETLRKPFKSPMVRDRDRDRDMDPASRDAASSPQPKDAPANPGPTPRSDAVATTPRGGPPRPSPAKQMSTPTRRPFSVPRPQHGVSPSPLRTVLGGKDSATKGGASALGGRTTREEEGREEILRQAERIQGRAGGAGETDDDLVELIAKWRAASRMAAEEVFEGSKERVEGMGGLKGWRKARREDEKRFSERMMDEDSARYRGGDPGEDVGSSPEGGGHQQDREEDEDDEEDEVSFQRGNEGQALKANMTQEFTMGTMLKSMNIDFDIIGYDEGTGWWRDG